MKANELRRAADADPDNETLKHAVIAAMRREGAGQDELAAAISELDLMPSVNALRGMLLRRGIRFREHDTAMPWGGSLLVERLKDRFNFLIEVRGDDGKWEWAMGVHRDRLISDRADLELVDFVLHAIHESANGRPVYTARSEKTSRMKLAAYDMSLDDARRKAEALRRA